MSDLQKTIEEQKKVIPDLYLLYDAECGLGHKRRSCAIAEYWLKRGGRVWYHHWENPNPKSVILIDGYNYEFSVYENFMQLGHLVVAMDDMGILYPCDILINYNIGADKLHNNQTLIDLCVMQILLGPDYFPVSEIIKEAVVSSDDPPFDTESVNRRLNYPAFIERMARAKYVMCTASVRAYEALYLNKPILIRAVADNQRPIFRTMLEGAWALEDAPENRHLFNTSEKERKMFSHGRSLIDGNGGDRIVDVILREYSDWK